MSQTMYFNSASILETDSVYIHAGSSASVAAQAVPIATSSKIVSFMVSHSSPSDGNFQATLHIGEEDGSSSFTANTSVTIPEGKYNEVVEVNPPVEVSPGQLVAVEIDGALAVPGVSRAVVKLSA